MHGTVTTDRVLYRHLSIYYFTYRGLGRRRMRKLLDMMRYLVHRTVPRPVVGFFRRRFLVPARRYLGRRLPIAMITGTKGKTTTTRMLAFILEKSGHRVGFTSTTGIVINGRQVNSIDSSGYLGAARVVNDPDITAAVLETARGDLLRVGLYRDRCDVAALLNVAREQVGMDGINSLEQMARLKKRVIDAARKAVVLNADDPRCAGFIDLYPTRLLKLFSLDEKNPAIRRHMNKGGTAYFLDKSVEANRILRGTGQQEEVLLPLAELPSCMNGVFQQNIANAMAAAALAEGMGVTLETIRNALSRFENSLETSPGRFNFIDGYSQTVLVDHAVNVPACASLVESLQKMPVSARRICLIDSVGNRPAWHYDEVGRILASWFDIAICFETEDYRRGKRPGQIAESLHAGFLQGGMAVEKIHKAGDAAEAFNRLSQLVKQDDMVVILICGGNPLPVLPLLEKALEPFAREALENQPPHGASHQGPQC